jgi:plastocyanin
MSTIRSLVLATAMLPLVAAQPGAQSQTVTQSKQTFQPGTVTVKAGATLVFKNDDSVTHNAFSTAKGNEFNSKAQEPGQSASVVLKTKGTVEVRCAFHPKMRLTVVVQ